MGKSRKESGLERFEKIEIETFRPFDSYIRRLAVQPEPFVFNGEVRVRRYRITVEEIESPVEVLAERIQALWDEADNHHHWTPLRNAAKEIGYELVGSPGLKSRR